MNRYSMACMYARMHESVCIYRYIYKYTYTHTNTHTHTQGETGRDREGGRERCTHVTGAGQSHAAKCLSQKNVGSITDKQKYNDRKSARVLAAQNSFVCTFHGIDPSNL